MQIQKNWERLNATSKRKKNICQDIKAKLGLVKKKNIIPLNKNDVIFEKP